MTPAVFPQRWASVDLGSNTFRLLVADETGPGMLRFVGLHQRVIRLAEGLRPGGFLGAVPLARAEEELRRFRARMDEMGATRRVGALAAVGRMARDGADFARRSRTLLDADIRVVSGRDEARLSARGALSLAEPGGRPVLCLDIGGGSTEVARVGHDGCDWATSLPVGVVGLWEGGSFHDPPGADEREHLEEQARMALDALPDDQWPGPWPEAFGRGRAHLVATAGTPLTVAAAVLGRSIHDTRGLSGVRVTARRLARVADRFWRAPAAVRASWPWMEPGRQDVILAGLALLQAVVAGAGAEQFVVSDGGLLEGILLEAVRRVSGKARWGKVQVRVGTTASPSCEA